MAERVIVKQDRQFRTQFSAADPEDIQSNVFEAVEDIHQLTPYGMLLGSLASCTALVMHTYAQNHDIKLREVELHMSYQRVFREDCEDCEEEKLYAEEIKDRILLVGDLSAAEREKLLQVAHYCPIYRMMKDGVAINSSLIEGKEDEKDEVKEEENPDD
jgi:uncharacterized OsmC-like protein